MAYDKHCTLLEFQERFRTEIDCLNKLEADRWTGGFICPKCGHSKGYRLSNRREIQCAQCRHQSSVTAGTMFHGTHTPLLKWFWAIYLVSQDKGGVSALRLSKQVGVTRMTAWLMLQKIRSAMGKRDKRIQLAGYIEIDEAFFGRAATITKPGKADNQSKVLVMIESEGERAGSLSMRVINSANEDTIRDEVKQKVKQESQCFRSDGWRAHAVIKSMGHELNADPVPPKQACTELPWVHIAISLAKRFLLAPIMVSAASISSVT